MSVYSEDDLKDCNDAKYRNIILANTIYRVVKELKLILCAYSAEIAGAGFPVSEEILALHTCCLDCT